MKKCVRKKWLLALLFAGLPLLSQAQGFGDNVTGLNGQLEKLFDQMLPLCSRLIDVGRAIGGFAALWYIGLRVWKHLAQAEPIDFYPLLKPFAIGLAIILFPALISLMNGVLAPVVQATADMSKDSKQAIEWHIAQEQKSLSIPPPGSYQEGGNDADKYGQAEDGSSGSSGGLLTNFAWSVMKTGFQNLVRYVVELIYKAAALCINTVRTFYLIVLAILGPLVLALSVFDGFHHTLASWFARYVHVYMWLPVANIFGAIISKLLANMLVMDTDFYSSTTYIIFMIIAIVGYFTVPTVAGYIIQPGGKDTLLHKVSDMSSQAGKAAVMAAV